MDGMAIDATKETMMAVCLAVDDTNETMMDDCLDVDGRLMDRWMMNGR